MSSSRLGDAAARLARALRSIKRQQSELNWTYTTALEESLSEGGDATFMKLAYLVLLGRPIDEATLDRESEALARGERTRAEIIREITSSLEFHEAGIIQDVMSGRADLPGAQPLWPGTSERVIEVPWVLRRLPSTGRLLDVGYAWSTWVYLKGLVALPELDVYGADLAVRPVPRLRRSLADARSLPYADAVFDAISCLSTIEHVGRDNERYGVVASNDPNGDRTALSEFRRVMRDERGVALLTVPMGAAQDHGWFVQYDRDAWATLVAECDLITIEQQAFRLVEEGWVNVRIEELDGLRYGEGAPGARGVLCTTLGPTKD